MFVHFGGWEKLSSSASSRSVFPWTFGLKSIDTRETIKDLVPIMLIVQQKTAYVVVIHLSTIVTDSVNRRIVNRSSVERLIGLNGGGDNIGAP